MAEWTEQNVARLRELATAQSPDGSYVYSLGKIGKAMGFSKNAVVGKLDRLGYSRPSPLKPRADGSKPIAKPKSAAPAKPGPRVAAAPSVVFIETPLAVPRRSMGASKTCQFPIGDPKRDNFRFCETPAVEGKPYCRACCAIAYVHKEAAE